MKDLFKFATQEISSPFLSEKIIRLDSVSKIDVRDLNFWLIRMRHMILLRHYVEMDISKLLSYISQFTFFSDFP